MSLVVEFGRRYREKARAKPSSGTAEIIIFPGVRFERLNIDAEIFEPDEPLSPFGGDLVNTARAAK